MTTAASFKPRATNCPRSTFTASDRRRTRGVEAPGKGRLEHGLRGHEKNATSEGEGGRAGKGLVLTRETAALDSRAAHQSGDA